MNGVASPQVRRPGFILLTISLLLVSTTACGAGPGAQPSALPVASPGPTLAPTVSASAPHLPTATFKPLPLPATPLSPSGTGNPTYPVISRLNAGKIGMLATLGESPVYRLLWSPDGKVIAALGEAAVTLFDPADLSQVRSLAVPDGLDTASCMAFSPNGSLLAVGTGMGAVNLFDPASGAVVRSLPGSGAFIWGLAFLADSRRLVVASNTGIQIWDLVGGAEPKSVDGPQVSLDGAWAVLSPDGGLAAELPGLPYDQPLRLWNAAGGGQPRPLGEAQVQVRSAAFSPDGRTLAAYDTTGAIQLWDTASGKRVRILNGRGGTFGSLAFSPDGKMLAAGAEDSTIQIWEATSGRLLLKLAGKWSIGSLAFSPDGGQLVSASPRGTVELWDLASGTRLAASGGHENVVWRVAFSPDSRILASSAWDGTVILWDVASRKPLHTLVAQAMPLGEADALAFSPDGSLLAAGYDFGTTAAIILWDVASGSPVRRWDPSLDKYSQGIIFLAFAPDGKTLVSGSWGACTAAWDLASGKSIRAWSQPSDGMEHIALSPDGSRLAGSLPPDSIRLLDLANGNLLGILTATEPAGSDEADPVANLAYSPDGATLAAGYGSGIIRLWDPVSGKQLRWMGAKTGDAPVSVAFSPDGTLLVSGENLKSILLWDLATGDLLLSDRPWGGINLTSNVAFSPDGTLIASGSQDGQVELWAVQP
jgi:WD40 repeat protein